jgi:hypothetical protein
MEKISTTDTEFDVCPNTAVLRQYQPSCKCFSQQLLTSITLPHVAPAIIAIFGTISGSRDCAVTAS